jgi:nitrogen fixation NifU-like protein
MQTNLSRQERLSFILQHADNPRHRGRMADADIVLGGGGGECAENITVYMKVDVGARITAASFEAEGTTLGRAAASFTVETITGRTLAEVIDLPAEVIVDTFGRDIVGDRLRAATVTLDTAKMAARTYLRKQR